MGTISQAEMHHEHGHSLRHAGHLQEALSSYDQAISLKPDFAEAHNSRGETLTDLGRIEAALPCYNRAVALKPEFAEAHRNRGNALTALGRPAEALHSHDRAIALAPNLAHAHTDRGDALLAAGRLTEALEGYDTAINLNPGDTRAHLNRGNALFNLGRIETALSSYDRAIVVAPDLADAHINRGGMLRELGRPEEALLAFDTAIALQPRSAQAHNNRAATLLALGLFDDALSSCGTATTIQRDDADIHLNRGIALQCLGRHHEAILAFGQAIASRPNHVLAHCGLSMCQLATGDYERGWSNYEWRPKYGPEAKIPWRGDTPADNKTILVRAEQGFGDTLQFCRYIPMLADRTNVILEVPRPLFRLLSGLRPPVKTIVSGDKLPHFDAWVPMMSLPRIFGTTVSSIPAAVPYLRADPDRTAAWRRRLVNFPGKKIGLVWAGASRLEDIHARAIDCRRSMTPRHFEPLASIPDLCFISLQKGGAATHMHGEKLELHDWTEELDDFADTADLIEALDLVISVDTSVVHLAGALGKPVWVLNRYDQCWRWLTDRSDSPWYPTARLFRQETPGDWSTVIRDVAAALRETSLTQT